MAEAQSTYQFSDETIHLTNLRVNCIIGVNPHERVDEQPVIVNASFQWDFTGAAADEDLSWTVNYSDVAQAIRSFARAGKFHLLETLARQLAAHLCDQFSLNHLTLHIRKPTVIADSDGPAVSLTVRRSPPKARGR
jgi:dihydroneopterin aldolase